MQHATITFGGRVAGKQCRVTVDLSAEYARPIPPEVMREILVRVAIKLTDPEELEMLVGELASPAAVPKPSAAEQSELPLLVPRMRLKLLKPERN